MAQLLLQIICSLLTNCVAYDTCDNTLLPGCRHARRLREIRPRQRRKPRKSSSVLPKKLRRSASGLTLAKPVKKHSTLSAACILPVRLGRLPIDKDMAG